MKLENYGVVNLDTGELLDDSLSDISYKLNEDARKEAFREAANKKSSYQKWAQLNLDYTRELMELSMKNGLSHALLYFLVEQMDELNAVMISSKVLEEFTGKSRQTISRALKVLKDKGFIAVFKSGNSNIYAINDKIYWKSYGKNRKFSKFPANIVLTASEQESLPKKFETIKKINGKPQEQEQNQVEDLDLNP